MKKIIALTFIIFNVIYVSRVNAETTETGIAIEEPQTFTLEDVELITNEILIDMKKNEEEFIGKKVEVKANTAEKNKPDKKEKPIGPEVGYVPEEAIEKFNSLEVDSTIDQNVNQLYKQAFAKENSGSIADALRLINQALHLRPNNKQLRLTKGRLQVRNEQYDAALLTLLPLCTKQNANWKPWYWIGTAQLMLGQHSAAANSLDESLAREGTDGQIWLNRAIVEQESGDHQTALQLLSIANDLSPNDPQIILSIAYSNEALGDMEKALINYRKFLIQTQNSSEKNGLKNLIMTHISHMDLAVL
ncbi:MAG: tetratricopeptide repeat protein [Gammaproteobacteria bacterium]